MAGKTKILVAPLNWGLGHATRCIPIIRALDSHGYEPYIASDGDALSLLKQEFPRFKCFELPSYNIRYSKHKYLFSASLLAQAPHILRAIKWEKLKTKQIIDEYGINGIISDNRPGVRNEKIKNVYLTHQLRVLSGITTAISTALHQHYISKFDQCWVPDRDYMENLSGQLGKISDSSIAVKYIGTLSRFELKTVPIKYDIAAILSGPEPQRSLLMEKLLTELKKFEGRVLIVEGKMEARQKKTMEGHITKVNFMNSSELEDAINGAKLIISRSGFSTIMDLAKLGKKAFFIPTPGQFEQEYLAARLDTMGVVPSCKQSAFNTKELKRVDSYSGFENRDCHNDFEELFRFFEGE